MTPPEEASEVDSLRSELITIERRSGAPVVALSAKDVVEPKVGGKGRVIALRSPGDFARCFNKYVNWCLDNPVTRTIIINKTGEVKRVEQERPMTKSGLANFIGCSSAYLSNISNPNHKTYKPALKYALEMAEDYMKDYNIAKGAIREFDGNLVARLTGINDKKQERQQTNINIQIQDSQAKEVRADLMQELNTITIPKHALGEDDD